MNETPQLPADDNERHTTAPTPETDTGPTRTTTEPGPSWVRRFGLAIAAAALVVASGLGFAVGHATASDDVPGGSVPAETIPGETVPGETVPGETVPGETVPGDRGPGGPPPAPGSDAVPPDLPDSLESDTTPSSGSST